MRIWNQKPFYSSSSSGNVPSGDVAGAPALALFDLADAFPRLAHAWLFAVLECIKLPKPILQVIHHLYYKCSAYSQGIGTGAFLF